MALVKTSQLIGCRLDWAVSKCEGTLGHYVQPNEKRGTTKWEVLPQTRRYSTNWAYGGPIIERKQIAVWTTTGGATWHSKKDGWDQFRAVDGPTPLIAAMRCHVASELGDEVEIPDEFVA